MRDQTGRGQLVEGALLRTALTFFSGMLIEEAALKLDREPPSLASTTGDDWPKGMERFLAKMMARERDRRFASATEAIEAWRKVCKVMGNLPRRGPPRSVPFRDDEADRTSPTFAGTISGSHPAFRPTTRQR